MSNYDKDNNPNFLSQLAQMLRENGNSAPPFNPDAPANSGTYSPYSTPEEIAAMSKSYDGQDNGIASQRALANAMRSKAMPQGKTIGSGKWQSYQAPNWGENLAGATEKIVGGYMAGQANRQDALLDEEKSEARGFALSRAEAERAQNRKLAADAVIEEANRNIVGDKLDQDKLRVLQQDARSAGLIASAKSGSAYQGTSMDAQHLNNITKYSNDRSNPLFIAAEQYLTRPKTLTDAAGTTTTTPGYNIDLILGGTNTGERPDEVVVPKPTSEAQKATSYSVGGMFDLHAREGANYIPNFIEVGATKLGEDMIGPAITSSKFKAQDEIASQWSRYKTLLMSGKTARADEVIANRNDFFPRFGDKEKDVARKQKAREAEMTRAIEAFELRTGEDFNEDTVIVIEPTISNVNSENMTPEQEKEAIYAKFPALRPQDND